MVGQNTPYAMLADSYAAVHGYDEQALAPLVAQQRLNANATSGAIFEKVPIREDDVLASRISAAPLRLLEIVMPCVSGAAVLAVDRDLALRAAHRPVRIAGAGEALGAKSIQNARDMLVTPVWQPRAFVVAGMTPAAINAVQIYDC